jgi:hypothetical protein
MSVLSLDDAKTHLNVTTSANDAELTSIIDAAEAAITARVGTFPIRVEQLIAPHERLGFA